MALVGSVGFRRWLMRLDAQANSRAGVRRLALAARREAAYHATSEHSYTRQSRETGERHDYH